MEQTDRRNDDTKALQRKSDQNLAHHDSPRRWPIVVAIGGLLAAGSGGVALIVWAAGAIDDLSVALTFIAQNTLSWFIFLALIVQVIINMMQWGAMRAALKIEQAKLAPRLRIDEVRVAGFDIGQSPAFIVSLVNEGATEAQDVALYVQAQREHIHAKWRSEQMVTVPANDRRLYPIRWSAVLNQEVIDTYNNEPRLKVFGYFKYKGIKQPFCYHYYPWIGIRPTEVPYFVPCDFDVSTDVNIGLEVQDSIHGHIADNITLGTGSNLEPDKGKKNGKREDDEGQPN